MRRRAVPLVLLLVVAAGCAVDRATRAPELPVVDARAQSIQSAGGSLLAVAEFHGPARLQWVRPMSLRPVSGPLHLREEYVSDAALSPDGATLAVGSDMHNRIEFVDLRRWRSLGSMRLPGPRPGGYGGASGLMWVSARRLLALVGASYTRAAPVVVDPVDQRLVHRSSWRGSPLRWERAGDRLVFLSAPQDGSAPGHGRLLSYDADGHLRQLRLGRIEAGTWRTGRRRWRRIEPGLAATRTHAYVVAADGGVVADVDLRAWRLDYHELSEARSGWRRVADVIEPPAHAKQPFTLSIRNAQVIPGGVIAVTGEDQDGTHDPHAVTTVPYGVRLIDPVSWTWHSVDRDAQDTTVAGGALLARRWSDGSLPPIGVRAYDTAGKLRFTRFAGKGTIVHGAAGDHVYVAVKRNGTRRIHVLDLESGETVRMLPYRRLRLLDPVP